MMGMNGGGPQAKNANKRQKTDMNPFSGLDTRLTKMEKILETLSTSSN